MDDIGSMYNKVVSFLHAKLLLGRDKEYISFIINLFHFDKHLFPNSEEQPRQSSLYVL